MRRIATSLFAAGIALVTVAAPVDFGTLPDGLWDEHGAYTIGATDDVWATKAYDGDKFTVVTVGARPSGYDSALKCAYDEYSYADCDSWLRSPALSMKAGVKYVIGWQYRFASGSSLKLSSWLSSSDPTSIIGAAAVKKEKAYFSTSVMSSVYKAVEYEFTPEADGDYYISYQLYADGYSEPTGSVFISAVTVKEINETPKALAPAGLTATAAPDGSLTVDLAWTLPTADAAGNELSGERAVTAVNVYRDGELLTTLEGAVSAWRDSEEHGLTPGVHSYAVAVLTGAVEGMKSETVTSAYVGPFRYAPLEITFGPWSTYLGSSGNGFANNSQKPAGYTNSASIWNFSEVADLDAWLVSPQFDLDPARTYRVAFQWQSWNDKDFIVEHFDVYVSDLMPSAETRDAIMAGEPLLSMSDIRYEEPAWKEAVIEGIKGDGPAYVLFHVSGRCCKRFSISAFSIEEYNAAAPFEPAAATGLSATAGEGLTVDLAWTLPTHSVTGSPFGEGQSVTAVRIYRDGEELITLEGPAEAFTDSEATGLGYGEHSYAVAVCVADVWSGLSEEVTLNVEAPLESIALPWEQDLKNLGDMSAVWTTWYGEGHGYMAGTWLARPAGLFLNNSTSRAEDAWLISLPVELESGKKYLLEYTATSNSSGQLAIGLTDSTEPDGFILTIAEPQPLPASNGQMSAGFTYETAVARETQLPRLAFRACTPEGSESHNFIISSVRLTENTDTSAAGLQLSEQPSEIMVFDLQGRSLGTSATLGLEDFGHGAYIVAYNAGGVRKSVKIIK
ncbi:MAG: hypothetical protein K2H03_04525 [Muribaculaceae bacterium]|nr:hypothetical protein [Muribaculaceae bacterium]